jgi:protein gp37
MPPKISWTQCTFNPITGCTKCSAGCLNCYAERQIPRLRKNHPHKYGNGFALTLHPGELQRPYRWRKPRLVFVCSMSDVFHEDVPQDFLVDLFKVMRDTPKHTYQVLTKRPERMVEFAKSVAWPMNVWAGTTVERNDYVHRADALRKIPAQVRFISAEPLLGPLPDLDLSGIEKLIVGGESGPGRRPMEAEWVRELRDRCLDDGVAFHFKQWAGLHPKRLGRELDGVTWDEMPLGPAHPARKTPLNTERFLGVRRHPRLAIVTDNGLEEL